jgi:hypothetical protein
MDGGLGKTTIATGYCEMKKAEYYQSKNLRFILFLMSCVLSKFRYGRLELKDQTKFVQILTA